MTDEINRDIYDPAYEHVLSPVWEYLALSSEGVGRADVIFVFGGIDLRVPQHAADLLGQGFAPRILVTGASGPLTSHFHKSEAAIFADEMVSRGVPVSAMLMEETATNTLQNVQRGMATLADAGVFPKTAYLVAKPFLMRRCVATFSKWYPDVQTWPSPPAGAISEFVDREPGEFALRLPAELRRLEEYAANGSITPQDIPDEVLRAADHIEALFSRG